MLIAVDIGNTNVHIGFSRSSDGEWDKSLRFSSDRTRTPAEWRPLLSPHVHEAQELPDGLTIVCCSVVPQLTDSFTAYVAQYLRSETLMVSPDLKLGISVCTDQPNETGADRIVNAAAAFAEFGGPVIVVDTGTATKIEAVTADGRFIGGAIAPGLGLAMDSLAQRAAQLYAVPLVLPERAIGANTTLAVQAGVVLGHVKMIEGLLEHTIAELGGAIAVVLTGGFADVLAGDIAGITALRPNLTLDGLRLIAQLNANF